MLQARPPATRRRARRLPPQYKMRRDVLEDAMADREKL
jgi:hypothetical protein